MSVNYVKNDDGRVVCSCGCGKVLELGDSIAFISYVATIDDLNIPHCNNVFELVKFEHVNKVKPVEYDETWFKEQLTYYYTLGGKKTMVEKVYKYLYGLGCRIT